MLVLSRKQNEKIVIDGNIEIKVLKVKGNTIRLGISAPSEVKVLRGELATFKVEMGKADSVGEESGGYETEDLERLPNPFAVAHAV